MNGIAVRVEASVVSLEGGTAGAPTHALAVGDTADLLGDGPGLDALSRLYVLMGRASAQTADGQRRQVEQAAHERHEALQKMIRELQQAIKEREEASGWGAIGKALSKVASLAAVGASVGLAVASCGAAAPVAALALSGAGLSLLGAAQSEFQVLEVMGFSPKVAGWIGVGCMVGGGFSSVGAGFFMAGSAAASGANAASETAKAASKTTNEVVRWINVAAGASGVAAGTAQGVSALYERSAAGHDIEAYKAQQFMETLQRLLASIIEQMKESEESEQSNVSRIVQAIETDGACLAAAVAATGANA